ncbi:MAG TPA: PKD domain-containing protein [Anaerolineae bacterium]|nr:PKD domain-containing protein [Anaerolineae bacterium]
MTTQLPNPAVRRLLAAAATLMLATCATLALVGLLPLSPSHTAQASGLNAGSITHTLVADFNICPVLTSTTNLIFTGTTASAINGGEIRLTSFLEDDFDGSSIDASKWATYVHFSGPPIVGNGLITLTDSGLRSAISLPLQSRYLDIRARLSLTGTTNFAGIGFGRQNSIAAPGACPGDPDCDGSTREFASTTDPQQMLAIAWDGYNITPTQGYTETSIFGADLTQFHTFRIEWDTAATRFYADGTFLPDATVTSSVAYSPYAWLTSMASGTTIDVDWVRLDYYPQLTGQYQSCAVASPLTDTHWTTLSWNADLPAGASAAFETRSSDDGVTWSAWTTVAGSGSAIPGPNGAYLQYRATLNTSDVNTSPEIGSVSLGYELNEAPTADASGPYAIDEGAPLTLNAASSSDPNVGDTLSYAWDVDNDGAYDDGAGITASVTFNDGPDTRTIGLLVGDTSGVTDTITATVGVNNIAPTATFNAPASAQSEGDPLNLSLVSPFDPSGPDTSAGFTYRFNCGDGSGWGSFSANNSTSCEAIDNPSQQVFGEIRDQDNGSTTYTVTFTINNVAPSATLSTSGSVGEGGALNATLTNPFDPGNLDLAAGFTYAFDCGDGGGFGSFGAITNTVCVALDNPSQTIQSRIQDKDGAITTYTSTVTVNNLPPAATFNAPPGALDEGDPIGLSFTGASDPGPTDDAAGFTYAFDCGDGLGFGSFSAAASANCTAVDNPNQVVRGRVQDKDGLFATYTTTLTVNNLPPDAIFNAPSATLGEGTAFSLTLTGPTDPGSADAAAGFTYAFDCGSGFSAYGSNNAFNCSALDNPSQQVRARLRDKDGAFETYIATFNVNNVAPTAATSGPYTGTEGSPIALTGIVTDPGAADTHTYLWTFGDGVTSTLRTPAHMYADNGIYTATFKATDKDSASNIVTTTVTVNNVAPTAVSGGPYSGVPGQPISFTGNVNDPGSVDTHTYLWNFGDGITATLQSPSHVYATGGAYTVTLTVTDKDGDSDVVTTTATIRYQIFLPAVMRNVSGPSASSPAQSLASLTHWTHRLIQLFARR